MKTILTDKLNVLPWLLAPLGLRSLWDSYDSWQQGFPFRAWFYASVGVLLLAIAVQRVLERRLARRDGRDPD